MNIAKLIGSERTAAAERSVSDRRWCSDRRVTDRRRRSLQVAVDRRLGDRRRPNDRRSGIDRRGNVAIKTLWHHSCGKVVGDDRACGQPAILRAPSGWRCFWHLDRRYDRRGD